MLQVFIMHQKSKLIHYNKFYKYSVKRSLLNETATGRPTPRNEYDISY